MKPLYAVMLKEEIPSDHPWVVLRFANEEDTLDSAEYLTYDKVLAMSVRDEMMEKWPEHSYNVVEMMAKEVV